MSDEAFDEVVQQAQARVGETLKEKWTLDGLLGVGGMASVYAATHRNQKRVAIKMLHPELSHNAAIRQRFLREGYIGNSVQHSGAVSVFDDDVTDDGCAFLVMELLDGETLDARWERKGKRLPPGEVLALLDRVLDTLSAAHARGIVHRDLKPENLFFTREAQVKVLDFGIARVRELSGSSKTQTGSLMGTPTFMPPEQARGRWEEVDARSDIWAIGATAFTLLSGEFVHVAGTVNEALIQAATQPPRSLGTLRPDLPASLIAFVDRSLSFDKDARWPDALAMQQGLREAYAALESDWDEETYLAEAAAALPETRLVTAPGTAGATALVTSASTPPPAARHSPTPFLIAAVVGVLALGGLLATVFGSNQPSRIPNQVHAAVSLANATAPSATLASSPAAPPPIAIDQLPSEEKRLKATPAATKLTQAVSAKPAPAPPATLPRTIAVPERRPTPLADPFAGRE
jgi:serine/threonine-protein kinase